MAWVENGWVEFDPTEGAHLSQRQEDGKWRVGRIISVNEREDCVVVEWMDKSHSKISRKNIGSENPPLNHLPRMGPGVLSRKKRRL